MNRSVRFGAVMALAGWLAGCSTVQGDFHQKLQIDALDALGRPVTGLPCRIGSGASAQNIVTPAHDVRVRRAMQSLAIECRRDNLIATATVKSRREGLEEALLPFGSAGVFVDALSGALFAYPTHLHLRVGQHVVLEHGGEARVAKSEPIASPAQATAATPAQIALAAVQPSPMASTAKAVPAAAPDRKARAAAPAKAGQAVAKPDKRTGATAVTAKPVAAPLAIADVRSAPVNW
jgi:hypothetical protein